MKAPSKNNPVCPFCNSKTSIKKGPRKNKHVAILRYLCKSCHKYFTFQKTKNITYPIKVILESISTYDLGINLKQTSVIINKRFRLNTSHQLIHSWIKKYKDMISYIRIRNKVKSDYPPSSIIFKKTFHHNQPYLFQYHKAKLDLFTKKFPKLKQYIESMENSCPNPIFSESLRCSDFKFKKTIFQIKKKQNYANKLAEISIEAAKNNAERHQLIESFMLINDTATIATEIPIYLTPNESNLKINKPLTGHIDILQIRFNKIHILDYKPNAAPDNETITQLYLYAKALSKRTNIHLNQFTCAFFDESNYFEFEPIITKRFKY